MNDCSVSLAEAARKGNPPTYTPFLNSFAKSVIRGRCPLEEGPEELVGRDLDAGEIGRLPRAHEPHRVEAVVMDRAVGDGRGDAEGREALDAFHGLDEAVTRQVAAGLLESLHGDDHVYGAGAAPSLPGPQASART